MVGQRKGPAAGSSRQRVEDVEAEDFDENAETQEDDGSQSQTQAEGSGKGKKKAGGLTDAQQQRAVQQLVRLALFSEYRKAPVKREDITKKILGNKRAAFADVFEGANRMLQQVFGLELYELRGKNKSTAEQELAAEAEEDEGPTEPPKSRQYIVRSLFRLNLRELLSVPEPMPIQPENELPDDEAEELPEESGAILDWSKGDGTTTGHVGLHGICYMILALILVSGRAIVDTVLMSRMKRLGIERDTVLPYRSTDSTGLPYPQKMTFEKYLDILVRQNYLEKHKVGTLSTDGVQTFEYKWGSRSDAEMGEKAIADFITEIFIKPDAGVETDDSDSEPEAPTQRRNRKTAATAREAALEKAKDRVVADITKAAGSTLTS